MSKLYQIEEPGIRYSIDGVNGIFVMPKKEKCGMHKLKVDLLNESIKCGDTVCMVSIEDVLTPVIRFEQAPEYGENTYRVIWNEKLDGPTPVYSIKVLIELVDIYTKTPAIWSLFVEY